MRGVLELPQEEGQRPAAALRLVGAGLPKPPDRGYSRPVPATIQQVAEGAVASGMRRELGPLQREWQGKLTVAVAFAIVLGGLLRIHRNRQLARIEAKLERLDAGD